MKKRALLGKLFLAVILVAVIFLSLSAYIKFSKNSVEITTGDVTINIDYNNTENNDAQASTISPPVISPPANQTDIPLTNLTYTNQTNQSQQYLNNSLAKE